MKREGVPVIAAFVLFLREGLEASLVVSILLAALRQLGQARQARAVWLGAGLAAIASLVVGAVIYATVRAYSGTTFQTVFETVTYLIAVVLLTSMTFWMQQHSRSMKRELTERASEARTGFAFGALAFMTVGREGLETAIFMVALAFSVNAVQTISGATLGILAALGLCTLVYRLGYRLDFRIFFRVMGILLLIFAAGLLGNAVQNLQELGWISFGTVHLWNTASVLSENSNFGDVLHTFLGYADSPTALQATLYALYLAVAGTIFYRMTRKSPRPASTVTPPTVPAKQA